MSCLTGLTSGRSTKRNGKLPPEKKSSSSRVYQLAATNQLPAVNSNPPAGNTLQSPVPPALYAQTASFAQTTSPASYAQAASFAQTTSPASFAQAASHPYSATTPFPPPQAPSASSASVSASPATLASSASSVKSSSASVRTNSSHYYCHGVPNNSGDPKGQQDWHYAQDVRAQVQNAPAPKESGYPSYFGNKGPDPLPLSANGPLTHTAIKHGTSQPYKSGPPGAHRAVYNDEDRSTVDVMYHDPTKPGGPGSRSTQFSMATYVPRASGKSNHTGSAWR